MMIDRTNYELFFIDLIDGRLSGKELDNVLDFIGKNPDLANELKDIELFTITDRNVPIFDHKALLKTDFDNSEVFEDTCIRAIENELSVAEKDIFIQYISNNKAAQNEFRLYKATVSEPNLLLVFENKEVLRKNRTRILSYVRFAAAAIVVIALFIYFPRESKKTYDENHIQSAHINPVEQAKGRTAESTMPIEGLALNKPTISRQIPEKTISNIGNTTSDTSEIISEENNSKDNLELMANLTTINAIAVATENYFPEIEVANAHFAQVATDEKAESFPTIKEYLISEIEEIKDKNKSKIGGFGMLALKKISGDKLSFVTSQSGKVEKVEFNSKILAFSIPVTSSEH